MFRLVCICAIMAVASAQGQRTPKAARYVDDPRDAAILSEQRYLSGDGTFGAAYTQEDGVDFKEESDAEGNRKGSYSYVDPSGQRRTISYTAGKGGFVATGDHIPVAPSGPAAPAQPQAAPRYNPAPQQQQQQYSSGPRTNPNEDDGQYYPELYENKDTQSRQQYSAPQPQYQAAQPQYQPAPQYQAAPQQQYSGVQTQAKYVAPKAQSYQPQPQYNPAPVQQQYNPAPAQPQYSGVQSSRAAAPAARPQQYFAPEEQTQSPHRFFPPGKLDLNRSPDGYSYSFSSKY